MPLDVKYDVFFEPVYRWPGVTPNLLTRSRRATRRVRARARTEARLIVPHGGL
jgi:hypothetical protein